MTSTLGRDGSLAKANAASNGSTGGGSVDHVVEHVPGPAERDRAGFARRRRVTDNVLRWGVPILLIGAWQLFAMSGVLDDKFFPAPSAVVSAGWDAIVAGDLQSNLWITVKRILIGFTAGALIGLLVGLLFGVVRPIRIAFEPIISALYTVPKLAILPLLLLIFGLDDTSKIILIALGSFFIVAISTTAAILAIPNAMWEPMQSFGASRMQSFRHLVFPAVVPEIFVALRIATGYAVLILIGIEMVQGNSGIGFMIWNSWQIFATDRMYVGIVVASALGVVLQLGIKAIGNRVARWKQADTGVQGL